MGSTEQAVKILITFAAKLFLMDSSEKILSTLKSAGKPMKSGEIAEATGIDKKEVDKTIKTLVAEGKMHSPKRCYYDLKG